MNTDAHKTALAQACLTLLAAWQASSVEGAEKDPEAIAHVERMVAAGTATLSLHIALSGGSVQIKGLVYPAGGEADPRLGAPVLAINGPMIYSLEQLAALAEA